jgi:hypothetical protein
MGGGGEPQLSYTPTIYMPLYPPRVGGGGGKKALMKITSTHKMRKLGGERGGRDNVTISKWAQYIHIKLTQFNPVTRT